MRGFALVVALASLTAAAQSTPRFKRFTQRTDQGRNSRGLLASTYAFFEAFPASGAGLTTACSTTAPTGAKGEALTFTRTGSATCTKTASGGLATTGIADGDLVSLSGNVARVEYDSAGVLGLLVESSRTNSIVRSQELNNAAWAITGTSVAGPVVTPDYGTAPDGTTTAERVQVAACSPASSQSTVSQTPAAGAGATANTYYVKALSGSPTIQVCSYGTTSNGSCTPCAVNTSTWTRCSNQFTTAGTTYTLIGCINNPGVYSGSSNTGAADVLVWGAQSEAGAYATSYIPTTTASAVRNAEKAYFDLGAGSPLRADNMSMAITSWIEGAPAALAAYGIFNVNAVSQAATSGVDSMWLYNGGPTLQKCLATAASVTGTVAISTAAGTRSWCASTATATNGSHGGVAMSAAGAPTVTTNAARWVNIGASPDPYGFDGIYNRVCADTSSTRCR